MTKLLPALSIAVGLGVAGLLAGHPALASEKISQGDMPKYCQGKAAAMLGTRPNNVLTLPVERDGDKYIVPGQSPRDGSEVTTFQCRFNSRREFLKVVVTGTPQGGAQASGPGKPVAESEMAKYCQGEAAGLLNTRPAYILTLPVERANGQYVVPGQSPPEGNDVTTFECRFNGQRVFQKVVVTGRPQGSQQGTSQGNSQRKPVAESEMAKYCQGEAAGMLNTRPIYILTLPVERDNGQYVVPGQSPPEGNDVTTFECRFDGQRVFQRVVVTGRP